MTTETLINDLLEREGGYVDHPADRGGPTQFGITATSWGLFKGFGRPATRAEVKAITKPQAVEFYTKRYVNASPFQVVAYEPLRIQLMDFAVLSGTERAVRHLQRTLDVPVTSTLDDRTKTALLCDRPKLVNNALVADRLAMFHGIVSADASQKVFLYGWTTRALSFLVA